VQNHHKQTENAIAQQRRQTGREYHVQCANLLELPLLRAVIFGINDE
jgi:hypothetical protein